MLHNLGIQRKIGLTSIWLGITHFIQGRYPEAHDCAQTGLSIMDEAGNLWTTGHAEILLGYTELALGKVANARAHLNLCVELFQELGQQDELSQAWELLAYFETTASSRAS